MLKVLIPPKAISHRIGEMANEIGRSSPGKMDALILLKGAFIFGSDLIRKLPQIRTVHFARPKSYHGLSTKAGPLTWHWPDDLVPQSKVILIIDDILDSGSTMKAAGELALKAGYEQILFAVLLRKVQQTPPKTEAHFVGFEIPDLFVVGYGLDFNENFRALPFIGVAENQSTNESNTEKNITI